MFSSPKQNYFEEIAYRDLLSVYADSSGEGVSQPVYDRLLAKEIACEVLQVAGGEFVRGRQVDAVTTFVVSIRENPFIDLNARVKIVIESGLYAKTEIYSHRIFFRNKAGRPARCEIHCKSTE